jgi:hypothetical protein
MKLAKALQFCFERSSKLQEVAHTPPSTCISSHPEFSDERERHRHHSLSSHTIPITLSAKVEQDTLESMNIQGAGFLTSSSLSLHPVSMTLNPAPMVQMSVEELVKPLGPTPNVLIVEDNPINVCIIN